MNYKFVDQQKKKMQSLKQKVPFGVNVILINYTSI